MSLGLKVKIVGVLEPTEKYNQMLNALESCRAAGVSIPKELWDFFDLGENGEDSIPPKDGMERKLDEAVKDDNGIFSYSKVYDIDLCQVPKSVKKIRIYAEMY